MDPPITATRCACPAGPSPASSFAPGIALERWPEMPPGTSADAIWKAKYWCRGRETSNSSRLQRVNAEPTLREAMEKEGEGFKSNAALDH
ncbi:hypothetical protein [Pseudoxanthomonas spadix]|uniref:hypothetical protein n=1 Tax=Pseudoxanthomonas spadix TaxID=415229 RepID=UPI0013052D08|nr:hypothetical protein [Pseudoxanthomonas spadix]